MRPPASRVMRPAGRILTDLHRVAGEPRLTARDVLRVLPGSPEAARFGRALQATPGRQRLRRYLFLAGQHARSLLSPAIGLPLAKGNAAVGGCRSVPGCQRSIPAVPASARRMPPTQIRGFLYSPVVLSPGWDWAERAGIEPAACFRYLPMRWVCTPRFWVSHLGLRWQRHPTPHRSVNQCRSLPTATPFSPLLAPGVLCGPTSALPQFLKRVSAPTLASGEFVRPLPRGNSVPLLSRLVIAHCSRGISLCHPPSRCVARFPDYRATRSGSANSPVNSAS